MKTDPTRRQVSRVSILSTGHPRVEIGDIVAGPGAVYTVVEDALVVLERAGPRAELTGPFRVDATAAAALLAGPLAAAALGALLEPTLLRPLYKRPEEYQLLITFGLQLILEDLVRLIWGPYPLTVSSLYEGMGSLNMGESIYPTYNLAVIVVGGLAAAGLWAFIYRTQFGVVLRATSQNMRMAQAMGVNVNRVYVQAFTLGCFMAGLGGAIVVPQQGAVLGMGVDALILAFVVVVIGGLGSLEGALIGALLVGVVRELGITLFPEVELAVLYLMATTVLLIRPAGLFGRA